MKTKSSIKNTFVGMVKEELVSNKGVNRYLLIALIANIPTPLYFIPYLTQAITISLLGFYAKQYPKIKSSTSILGIPVLIFILVMETILLQFFWVPFFTQLLSIALIVLLYICTRKD